MRRRWWPSLRKSTLRSACVCVALLLALHSRTAHSQTLDLDVPPAAPELDRFTFANDIIGKLEQEIADSLAKERGADPIEKLALQTMVNIRIIAADLLTTGDKAAELGSVTSLAGLTLAQHRSDIDATMQDFIALSQRLAKSNNPSDADQSRLRIAVDALRLFNDNAVANAADLRTVDVKFLDRAMAAMFMPLADAVSAIDRKEAQNQWIQASKVTPTPAMAVQRQPGVAAPIRAPQRTVAQVRNELFALSLRDDTKAELSSIVDFLERGSAFPDLRPQVDASLRHISQVIDLLNSLQGATWLDDKSREAYLERLHLGVVLFKDPRTRERGQRHLDRLESSRVIIDRITTLAGVNVRINSLRDAFLDADAMIENPAQADLGQQQLRKLDTVLARMIAFRELKPVELRRELQVVVRQLEMQYEDSEKRLLNEIETLATNPGALTDPGFASLMQNQEQYLSDIERVRRMPDWVDKIRLIDPGSAGPFHNQSRKMAQWLLDSNRRPDALRAMDQIEQQLALFYPLPFEGPLRTGDAVAVKATGGLNEQFLRVIDNLRRNWARAWADGDAGSEEANHLLLIYRLLQTMEDTAHVIDLRDASDALNRWSAWELSETAVARTVSDLPSRLKLATDAAVKEDQDALARQLEEIDRDAPVVKLLGRLAQVIGKAALDLPDGAVGCMGQLTGPPGSDAWWANRRNDLATLCRYQTEAEFARTVGREELLDALTQFVNARANDMLTQLGERQTKIPTLIGFDGSDPNPEVEMPDRVRPIPRKR